MADSVREESGTGYDSTVFDISLPRFSVGDNNVIYRFENGVDGLVVRIPREAYDRAGEPESLSVQVWVDDK